MLSTMFLLITILGSSGTVSNPDPYCQASIQVRDRKDVLELVAMGLEVRGWDKSGELSVVAKRSSLSKAERAGFLLIVEIADLEAHYSAQMSGRGDFGDYYTYSEAVDKMNELHSTYPTVTTAPESIGVSVEGNIIWAMKVSDNPGIDDEDPEILFTGVHHAREPISCTACLDFINYLASGYGTDSLSTFLVRERQIWFVPVVNPDGYLYNESTYPDGGGMWRKNRRDNGDGSHGVDPNRNYPFNWGYDNSGSSPYPDDDTYRGPSAASEPEIQTIMRLCTEHQFTCAQNWHSYWNALLYPWGYDDIYSPDDAVFDRLAQEATTGLGYQTGTAWEILYNVNGDANDWMYGDELAKPKIFACTAEIGESFWQESAIPDHILETRQISITFAKMGGPVAEFEILVVEDGEGNDNGRLDAGETADLFLSLTNIGFHQSDQITATVISHDTHVEFNTSLSLFAPFPALTTVEGSPLSVTIYSTCPSGYAATCSLEVQGSWVMTDTLVFQLPVGIPTVLLVDSDDEPTELHLVESLARSGYSFDRWDRPTQGAVPLSVLRLHRAVVWTAGDQNTSSLQAEDRASVAAYLDIGGALLLSAENYLSAYGDESFTSDYLHIQNYTTSIDISTVHGVPGDPVTDGVTMQVSFPGGLSAYPDAVVPDGQASGILTVDSGSQFTAHRFPASGSSVYRMIFTATPLETLHAGSVTLDELLYSAVHWLLQSSDAVAPSAPEGLTAEQTGGQGQISLSWQEASDDVAVAHYRLYQNPTAHFSPAPAVLLEAVAGTSLSVEGPGPTEELYWCVTAVDAAGNESAPSVLVGATAFELIE